jgi:hypothetical protein
MVKKNNGGRGGKRKNGSGRSRSTIAKRNYTRGFRGITQSVALSVNNAYGDTAKPQAIVKGLDAFDTSHVPLPRAVGDYSVVRTTEIFSSTSQLNLFGPMMAKDAVGNQTWSNICALSSGAGDWTGRANHPINMSEATIRHTFESMAPGNRSWQHVKVTPAAYTVKIMNPEALQTTSGMVYIGRAKQMLNPGGDGRTYEQLAQGLVSYSTPELCAAGRLAMRGVKVDAVPYDINALSDFRTMTLNADGSFTWANDSLMYDGFAPIFVYNPNYVNLQFMVCCEWRVRFDPDNPAYATHTYHQPSTLGYWDRVQRMGSALGNGVMDLAEKSGPKLMMHLAEKAVKRQFQIAGG